MENVGVRVAEVVEMVTGYGVTTHLEFTIPSRGIMGYLSEFRT